MNYRIIRHIVQLYYFPATMLHYRTKSVIQHVARRCYLNYYYWCMAPSVLVSLVLPVTQYYYNILSYLNITLLTRGHKSCIEYKYPWSLLTTLLCTHVTSRVTMLSCHYRAAYILYYGPMALELYVTTVAREYYSNYYRPYICINPSGYYVWLCHYVAWRVYVVVDYAVVACCITLSRTVAYCCNIVL